MALLRRNKRDDPTPDPTLGDPEARAILAAVGSGDWERAADATAATADPDRRELLVSTITRVDGWPDWLDAWTDARPDDALTWTVRGAHGVHWAWEARGDAMAVEREAFAEFRRRLEEADATLTKAAAMDPEDATPHAHRLIAARGLELDAAEIAGRFDAATGLAPLHRYAHNHMLQALTAKWGGSHDEMFAFARARAAVAPHGNGLKALVAEAHIERWLWILVSGEGDQEDAARYWTRPNVHEELLTMAEASVLAPTREPSARQVWDEQLFAFCFWYTDHTDLAAELLARSDVVSPHPWEYLGKPGKAWATARAGKSR
jgi:hypothetical protein